MAPSQIQASVYSMKTDLVPEATIKPNLKYEIKKKKGKKIFLSDLHQFGVEHHSTVILFSQCDCLLLSL